MEDTFPLREDWIQEAIEELAAGNAWAALARHRPAPWQEARADQSGAFHSRVTGPVKGYYIASHACRANGGRAYTSTYKICDLPPSSYWTAQSVMFGSCKHTEATGERAMASAEAAAARMIADMPIRVDRG